MFKDIIATEKGTRRLRRRDRLEGPWV